MEGEHGANVYSLTQQIHFDEVLGTRHESPLAFLSCVGAFCISADENGIVPKPLSSAYAFGPQSMSARNVKLKREFPSWMTFERTEWNMNKVFH